MFIMANFVALLALVFAFTLADEDQNQCINITPVKNFNFTTWAAAPWIIRYDATNYKTQLLSDVRCPVLYITEHNPIAIAISTKTDTNVVMEFAAHSRKNGIAYVDLVKPEPEYENGSITVFDTDYDTYSVTFTCAKSKTNPGKRLFSVKIYSRKRSDPIDLNMIKRKVKKEVGNDVIFEEIDQTNCCFH